MFTNVAAIIKRYRRGHAQPARGGHHQASLSRPSWMLVKRGAKRAACPVPASNEGEGERERGRTRPQPQRSERVSGQATLRAVGAPKNGPPTMRIERDARATMSRMATSSTTSDVAERERRFRLPRCEERAGTGRGMGRGHPLHADAAPRAHANVAPPHAFLARPMSRTAAAGTARAALQAHQALASGRPWGRGSWQTCSKRRRPATRPVSPICWRPVPTPPRTATKVQTRQAHVRVRSSVSA